MGGSAYQEDAYTDKFLGPSYFDMSTICLASSAFVFKLKSTLKDCCKLGVCKLAFPHCELSGDAMRTGSDNSCASVIVDGEPILLRRPTSVPARRRVSD